jgi:hypothetical protein
MSYEDDVRGHFLTKTRLTTVDDQRQDLLSAMGHIKHGNTIANEHRKRAASLPFRLANYVTGSTGVNWINSMTPVELHAELVYAESLFEKARILTAYRPQPQRFAYGSGRIQALLGIVYSGDWLAFIKEACALSLTWLLHV